MNRVRNTERRCYLSVLGRDQPPLHITTKGALARAVFASVSAIGAALECCATANAGMVGSVLVLVLWAVSVAFLALTTTELLTGAKRKGSATL